MFKSFLNKIGNLGNQIKLSNTTDSNSSNGEEIVDDIADHARQIPQNRQEPQPNNEKAPVQEETNKDEEEEVEGEGEEEKKSPPLEEFSMVGITPATFLPFSPRGDVFAAVNIVQASPSIRQIVDKSQNFSTYLKLVKQEPSYTIEIHSRSSGKRLAESLYNLEIAKILHRKKQILSVQFQMGVGVQVQFLHLQHLEYFHKILNAVIQFRKNRNNNNLDEKHEEEFLEKMSKLNPYKVDLAKIHTMLSHLALTPEETESKSTKPFYEIHCDSWELIHTLTFFGHVFIQLPGANRFPSLLNVMKKKGFLKPEFLPYYSIEHLVVGLQKSNRQEIILEKNLRSLMEDDIFRNAIEREFIVLRTNGGLFPINRYTVLRKVTSLGEQTKNKLLDLNEIIYLVNTSRRYLWDVEACRSMILSYLVIQRDMESHVKDLEKQFLEHEKKVMSTKIGNCPWDSSMRHVYIKDTDWTEMLEEFNDSVANLPLERVSYRVFRRHLLNNIRRKRRILEEQEEEEDPRKNREERERIIAETYMLRMKDASDEEELAQLLHEMKTQPDIPTLIETIEEHILLFSDTINAEEEHEKSSHTPRVIQKPYNHSKRTMKEWENNAKMEFLMQPQRIKFLHERLLLPTLRRKSSTKMSEFGCKLVLSIRKGTKVGGTDRRVMMLLDKYIHKWGFFKYGWVHSNVMVGCLGLHWFSDSLVTATNLAICENLYKEIIALDCHCPLIVDYNNVFRKISTLAMDIVEANLNTTYVLMRFWEKKGYLNCQEFTEKLMVSLDYTDFFPEVVEYINLLKFQLSNSPVHTEKKLRYITVNKKMWRRFEKVLKERFGVPDKQGKMFMDSHRDIDDFYRLCGKVDPMFQLNYPGIYQLLKGFDRAMWMRLKSDIFDDIKEKKNLQPSRFGCGFTKDNQEDIFEPIRQ